MQEQNMNTSGKSTFWIIGVVVVALLVALVFFLKAGQEESRSITQNTEQVLVIPEVEIESTVADTQDKNLDFASQLPLYDDQGLQFESSGPLPELAKSDAEFTQDILTLSAQLKPGLFKQQVIRKSVFSINDISQGMRPPVKRLRELSFTQPFSVHQVGDKMYMSQASYRRYDQLAQAVNAIDKQMAVALYQKYLPLLQQVFQQLSYPENYQVLDIIKSATAKILEAPVITGKIEVIRPSVRYKFANPKLEKLTAVDKQMLRMGPENTRLIQDKLRELVQALIESEKE
ncbi:MAG: DUF3014 domain-containing protein [Gammaproteobacteria bacterium]|nr:MAG: DUF3014 domain-containing protein [Gammaproteobacteria bacterium]